MENDNKQQSAAESRQLEEFVKCLNSTYDEVIDEINQTRLSFSSDNKHINTIKSSVFIWNAFNINSGSHNKLKAVYTDLGAVNPSECEDINNKDLFIENLLEQLDLSKKLS